MSTKSFLLFLGFYYPIWLQIIQIFLTINKQYFLENLKLSAGIGISITLAPFIILVATKIRPSFAKWLRVFLFRTFRVKTFCYVGLVVIILFNVSFILSRFGASFGTKHIIANVFAINLLFLLFIALVIAGRFQIRDPNGLLIKRASPQHHHIYLYEDGKLRHIPDPPTLVLLGYSFSDVQEVSEKEFRKYDVIRAIESVTTAQLIRDPSTTAVYVIHEGKKRHVPDQDTLNFILQRGPAGLQVQPASDNQLRLPTGKPLARFIDILRNA